MVNLPELDINFKQLATTFIERSARGTAILIIRDDTNKTFNYKEYIDQEELDTDKALYSVTNYTYLSDILSFGVAKLCVVRIDTGATGNITDALNIIGSKQKTGWISIVGTNADYVAINTWIKARANEGKTYMTLNYKVSGTDHKFIHNFTNPTVTFKDSRGKTNGVEYIPSFLAILCVCNIVRGVTYYVCKNLKEVEGVADVSQALNNGELILINDYDKVRVGTGINTMITFDKNEGTFEDMRYIEVIEATNMITDDVRDIYKEKYVGACKNNLDNQMIFISAVNTYFSSLADDEVEVLDKNYDNVAYINVIKQRKAWETVNAEAKTWDDTKVKNMAFKRSTFLGGGIKVLGCMMDLDFDVYMV